MSGAEWRYTDDQGVERSVDTDELRLALSSGKMPGSTLVWRQGLAEWAPAFTMPELSSAAIAAARRSVPPTGQAPPGSIRPVGPSSVRPGITRPSSVRPIGSAPPVASAPPAGSTPPAANAKRSAPPPPPRRNARGVHRTLTGIEPPEVLEALGLGKRPIAMPTAESAGSSAEIKEGPHDEPTQEGAAEPKRAGRAAKLEGLGDDDDSWDDATDVIPRAPGMPRDIISRDILKLAAGRSTTATPPSGLPAVPVPKRDTYMGVGGKNLAPTKAGQAPSRPPPPLPPRGPTASGSIPTASFGAITAPAPASEGRGILPSTGPRSRPPPPPVRKRSEPPPPRLKTLEMQVPPNAATSGPVSARKPEAPRPKAPTEPPSARPKPAHPPPGRSTSLGLGGQAAPAAASAPAAPAQAAASAASASSDATSVGPAVKDTFATQTAMPAITAPPASTASPASAPRTSDARGPAGAASSLRKPEAAAATSAAFRAAMLAPTPMVGSAPITSTLGTDTTELALPPEAKKSSPAEEAMRRPLAAGEKTSVMIRDAASSTTVDLPEKKVSRTLEMELDDHSKAAAKDPAPPESAGRRSETESKSVPKVDSQRPRRAETTDGTASSDTGDLRSSTPAAAMLDDDELPPPRKNLHVPMSAVLAVSTAWVLGLVAFFFVGRVSGFKSAARQMDGRTGIGSAFQASASAAAPGPTSAPAAPKPLPCWVALQSVQWAADVSKAVPFDMRARDTEIELGFATDEHHAVGLRIDPKAGTFEKPFEQVTKEDISRVAPLPIAGTFYVGEAGERTLLPLAGHTALYLVLDKDSIGLTDAPDQPVVELWKHEGKKAIGAEQVLPVGDGYLLTFRRDNAIFAGYFGPDKKPRGELTQISESDSELQNGKPRIGTNGVEVAITYAVETVEKVDDKESKRWKIALGRAPIGKLPSSPSFVDLPPKVKDKISDAIAPDIVGLRGGRWLLMWTEGVPGDREVRAQTYDATLQPLGNPIALSRPGNFGQAVLTTVDVYAAVAFLQASDSGFELWGAVLQCDL